MNIYYCDESDDFLCIAYTDMMAMEIASFVYKMSIIKVYPIRWDDKVINRLKKESNGKKGYVVWDHVVNGYTHFTEYKTREEKLEELLR